jgi:hypothetical protein
MRGSDVGVKRSPVSRLVTFSHPVPCRPPYSMNHGTPGSEQGARVVSWSAETTGKGPGSRRAATDVALEHLSKTAKSVPSGSGGEPVPNDGTWATTATRSSTAPRTTTSAAL